MEQIQSINYTRILWCCNDYGITPEELFKENGIAERTRLALASGDGGLSFNQLHKIAEYFGRGVLFFLEPEPVDATQVHTPQFRTLANQKPDLSAKLRAFIERVEKQREVYLALCEELEDTDRPLFTHPDLPCDNVREAARIAREWLGLSDTNNTFDTYRSAVESKGILVFRSAGYLGKWKIEDEHSILGFTLYDSSFPVIVVKKEVVEPRQTFTLMHELAHLLLHKESLIDDENDLENDSHYDREQEANRFASYLLVPDRFLNNISDDRRPNEASGYHEWLRPFRKGWGVSGEVIVRRLVEAGRLPKSDISAYRAWLKTLPPKKDDGGSREWRHREPKHLFGDSFVRTVLNALSEKKITLVKASSYLDHLKIKDIHKLEKHCENI